jgi:hypothetical protein
MANPLAIAGVTAVLKDLLNDGLINHQILPLVGQFAVSAQPLDRLAAQENANPSNRLNLFLYRIARNTGWSPERLPSRSPGGERLTNPYLALDLYYLLSAYGKDDLQAEILLGYGVFLLHENPVLGRDQIRESLQPPSPIGGAILPKPFSDLDAQELADQLEQIKISPLPLELSDLSALGSAYSSGLRTSAAYRVGVVLIEAKQPTRSALPVKERRLVAAQLRRPRLDAPLVLANPAEAIENARSGIPLEHGMRLVIPGAELRSEHARVEVDGEEVLTGVVLDNTRLQLDVGATWLPGLHGVQVDHARPKEAPSSGLLPIEASNVLAFTLHPSFAVPGAEWLAPPLGGFGPGDLLEGTIRVFCAHPVGRHQRCELLLNELRVNAGNVPSRAYAFATQIPDGVSPTVTEIDFAVEGLPRLTYLVRLRIDGVASDPKLDPADPVFFPAGIPSRPRLELAP